MILLVLTLLTACQSKQLVYVQESNFGFNVGAGAEGVAKLSLGYDRDVYSIVPKKNDTGDVMSIFAINKAVIKGINEMTIEEFVATGEPAKALANDSNAIKTLRDDIYGGPKK
jgi:hypothetical protein